MIQHVYLRVFGMVVGPQTYLISCMFLGLLIVALLKAVQNLVGNQILSLPPKPTLATASLETCQMSCYKAAALS